MQYTVGRQPGRRRSRVKALTRPKPTLDRHRTCDPPSLPGPDMGRDRDAESTVYATFWGTFEEVRTLRPP